MPQLALPYSQIRGGSSKGLYFLAEDLPASAAMRDAWLLALMGGDHRQIDGLGGADPLTSKVAIVSRSERPGVDVDYLFAQVVVGKNTVDTRPNCGNILAGVGPFAIESGLIPAGNGTTRVVVHMVNSGKECELLVQTPGGNVTYAGDARIDGVPGTAAPIICHYRDLAGSACGSLLPTGNTVDVIDDIAVTCIDNGMPVAIMSAQSMGIQGNESPEELNNNRALCERIYRLRIKLGERMNLGDVRQLAVPKMCMVSRAQTGGAISTRTFIPDKCHAAIGVLGAVSVASACMLPGSVAAEFAELPQGNNVVLSIEHPAGEFSVQLDTEKTDQGVRIVQAGVLRTARLLSRGEVFLPEGIQGAL